MNIDKYFIPNDDDVSADDIHPGAVLRGADLSEAVLRGADLSGAILRGADFSEAELGDANLSDAELVEADLSGAELYNANLSKASLFEANLSEVNLFGTDLSEAFLAEVTLRDTTLARSTTIDNPSYRIEAELAGDDGLTKEQVQDITARANHKVRVAYRENGLLKQARDARVRERKARRNEALAEEGHSGTGAFLLSCLSQVFTGYGVQLLPVLLVMSVLFLGSAAVYTLWGGMPVGKSLYYSIVTFTTSPPQNLSEAGFGLFATLVAGFETFAGTTAIIFLGYVLGTRERV